MSPGPGQSPLEADDLVPTFRADLKLQRKGGGVYEVEDPVSGRRFQLYDFEVNLARMLNGHRRASEVLEAGLRLGIPVTLESLQKFIRQLDQYGFLGQPQAQPPELPAKGPWKERDEWDPGVRALYQSGIRLLRQGRFGDARGYFQSLLELDPQNTEAHEALALVEERSAVEDAPATQVGPSPVAAPLDAPTPARQPRRGRLLFAGALLGTMVIGVTALLLFRRGEPSPPVPPRPEPVVSAPVDAGAALVVQAAPVVDAGVRSWRSDEVRVTRPPIAQVLAPTGGPVSWARARGVLVNRGERLGTVGGRSTPKTAALEREIRELEKLAKTDAVYEEFLEKAQKKLRKAGGKPIPAPVAGVFLPASPTPKARPGTPLAQIGDPNRFEVSVRLEEAPPLRACCELEKRGGGARARCSVRRVESEGPAFRVVADLPSTSAPWLDSEPGLLHLVADACP